jgi:hypothetical protein
MGPGSVQHRQPASWKQVPAGLGCVKLCVKGLGREKGTGRGWDGGGGPACSCSMPALRSSDNVASTLLHVSPVDDR